jgi:predicted GNAT family acetyltransferase
VDIGVLTDLDYRRRGLGKAVVSAICAHYTGDPRVLCYRHDLRNVASQGVADSLGFVHYATVEGVRRRT